MKKVQRNYLNMAQAVCDVFTTTDSWQPYGVITESLKRVKDLYTSINQTAMLQQQHKSNGHTAATDLARKNLEDFVYTISMRLKTWAETAGEVVVLNHIKSSRTALRKMALQSLLTYARVIADACEKNINAIASYYFISDADIKTVLADIDRVAQLNGHRDAVIDRKIENTSRLEDTFVGLRKELKTLDTLMKAYITDGILLSVYFNARRIHDVKGGSAKVVEEQRPAA